MTKKIIETKVSNYEDCETCEKFRGGKHALRVVNEEWLDRYGVNSSAPAPESFSITNMSELKDRLEEMRERLEGETSDIVIRNCNDEIGNVESAMRDIKAGKAVYSAYDEDGGWFLAIEKESV